MTIDNPIESQTAKKIPDHLIDSILTEWDNAELSQYQVIRRQGQLTSFDANKIAIAITKAFLEVEGHSATSSNRIKTLVQQLTKQVLKGIERRLEETGKVHIEEIQDQVELALMREGEHKVAREYVLYRERHATLRAERKKTAVLHVKDTNNQLTPLDEDRLRRIVTEACDGLEYVNAEKIVEESLKNLYDGISEKDVSHVLVMSARALVEKEPNYTYVASRLLLDNLRTEALSLLKFEPHTVTATEMRNYYADYFKHYIHKGIALELLNPSLADFNLDRLGMALIADNDLQFTYLGLQTLYDRYFLHSQDTRFELPQAFFMRVAMGLAINEIQREERAIEFYKLLSSFDFMSSTPTLFNSGTLRSQLSSCFVSTVPDDLDGIFGAIKDNAMMQKWAGGIGNDWTPVRGMGARIKGTNGKSQGVVPFLKVANDTLVSVNQGGKRKGSGCAYLETWHIDIEEFLELRKNTGDERRRTHDMNTANWIPDLFMQRVMENGHWSLFSPDETPDLHELHSEAFKTAYEAYEALAEQGKLKIFKRVSAVELWRKMLTMLFETGHPWICFKDPCNIRSPQQHVGVVHSSNLCCIAADQRVVTDRGLLTVGELYQLGGENKVVGLDGIYAASKMLLPRPNAPIVRINTSEGYTHKVTPDHKVWVKDIGWVEAQHLKAGDKLLIQQLEGLWGTEHKPELSYLMGLIAGDGTFDKNKGKVYIDVWSNDFDYLPSIENSVHHLLDGNTVLRTTSTNTPAFAINEKLKRARLSSAPLYRLLEQHGFTPQNKLQVPEIVWRGDRETVMAYLKGLYQADGNILSSHEVTTLALASTDLAFIQSLQILWANFGVKSSINQMRGHELHPMPDGKGGHKEYWSKPLYRLLITSIKGCQIAESITQLASNKSSLAAKQYLDNLQKKGYSQKLYATFTELTKLPNEDAYCLTVDSDTHAWTVNGMITKNTEITLNTSRYEIAVCNLGSVNLARHINNNRLDVEKLQRTVKTAMRMLDNVIDINYYAVPQARTANLRHRPIGLGIMGFQDALYQLRIPYSTDKAVEFADESMEYLSYFAIEGSTELAVERGKYSTFLGSLWSQGILPIDSIQALRGTRGQYLEMSDSSSLDWEKLREKVKRDGMRNSNCMAIAPTATISNIVGVTQSIEPTYQNLFVKSNLSGEFTVVNPYLVRDLKTLNLWDDVMVNDLKYFDGSVQNIDRVPNELKALYATAFEVDPSWLIEAGSRRQKWIDQSQSLNLYLLEPSGRKLDLLYKLAWIRGLKTTYYLRTMGATHVEKNTVRSSKNAIVEQQDDDNEIPKACLIDDPDCEACQ
ncbi:ribonucleotide reductase, alpha subunit [Beggiatoa alba B18LD]|uniref:Ribonucleoside-diphosphate reductase n=1 Tax=Beggiatoa alba B18LD TaxID=395493 RepID=I3CC23_9GAMM|nr:ribonucleoside-diphosphate reductase subunit alpha [Beggiatoa alba]EIJ41166.1 ribonucleotide reductase, alpha subunit [Beggiatoa alba B18LD]